MSIRPVEGGEWQEVGTIVDNGYMMPRVEQFVSESPWWTVTRNAGVESRTMTLTRTYKHTFSVGGRWPQHRMLELMFNVRLPRAARSLRRRRAKLRRKRRMRARR